MRTPTRKNRDADLRQSIDETLDAIEPDRHAEEAALPVVAVIGRPNVGKSTLFNRLIGRRKAIVHDRPGVTRDRNIGRADWDGVAFLCVDTGGFDVELDDPLLASVVEQVDLAIRQADAIVLLAAVGETAHPADEEIVRRLRGLDKPVLVAVNKCDSPTRQAEAMDFYRFGFEKIYPISALHGIGVADLLEGIKAAIKALPPREARPIAPGQIRLAIVGRQNVGKSTLVNQLAGEQRVIVAAFAGTTRDAIDTDVLTPDGRTITLIDTAGIRRRGKVERGVEKLSVLSSMLSLRRANVAALVIDGSTGIVEQDAHVAGYCVEAGLPTMIVVNKWDVVEKDHRTADQFTKKLEDEWGFIRHAPVLYVSAKTGLRAQRVFDVAERIYANASRRIQTAELNGWLHAAVTSRPVNQMGTRRPKIRYITQVGVLPPTFVLFVNEPALFHFSYQRYLINQMRETWDFEGTPIRLFLRSSKRETPAEIEPIDPDAKEGAPGQSHPTTAKARVKKPHLGKERIDKRH
jgi:GTP-binding protein